MKVLMLNGSPRVNGNTAAALEEMCSVFAEEGVETELGQYYLGWDQIRWAISRFGAATPAAGAR